MWASKGMVFERFWFEIRYRFWPSWSEIGCVFSHWLDIGYFVYKELFFSLYQHRQICKWETRNCKGPHTINAANVGSTRDLISQKNVWRQTIDCCPLLRSYFIGSCHVGVSKRFSRSISLAVCCKSVALPKCLRKWKPFLVSRVVN